MTDAISSVSSSSAASTNSSSSSTSKISEDTKKKLQALGLDPDDYSSEAAAQSAITQAQQKQQSQQTPQSNSSMDSIVTNVKSLASKMGAEIGNNDTPDDMLDKISTKISELTASAGTDESKKSEASVYQSEYDTLKGELDQAKAAMNMTGATALGNYNKAALNLAA